ncbi:MAG: T9SS type A sorting domain-containing protein, partial [Sphingobacteriales bacterium]|nr:T9SS type A sorting domain-containing protein [Sphingobacteriales bacterium]
QPTLACYETASFNTTTCSWDVTGTQPAQPTLACYETASFNTTTCSWDVTGTQPAQPTLACYESASFNTTTCSWDVTGTQPAQPTLACYETASFNTTTCLWDVTGTQPAQPTLACYETASFNTTTCLWDVTGTQPAQPTLACYESASFNTTTCSWDVTGTQPAQPSIACYETATFNGQTCQWDVTGTQPSQPSIACYETATFNGQTCQWDVTGSPNAPIVTSATGCDSYTWSQDGNSYTASGTYTSSSNCQDYVLNLSITASTVYYVDNDGDGYGSVSFTTNSCNGAPSGHVSISGDCDDSNASINPGVTEVCNSIDDNCDGSIDNGLVSNASPGTIGGTLQSCRAGIAGTATFTVSGITSNSGFAWTVPAGFSITSGQGTTTVSVSYTAAAIQAGISGQLCAISTDVCGATVSSCAQVDYQVATPVTPPSISGPSRLCVGDVATYSIAAVYRASTYTWNLPAGIVAVSGMGSNVITVSVSASYAGGIIGVSASNVCGSSPLRTKAVTTNTPNAAGTISGPKTGLCNAGNVVYSISAVSGATSYLWSVSGGTLVSGQGSTSISVSFATFSSGTVNVQAVNACGASLVRSLAVFGAPARPGAITGPVSVCVGDTANYSIATVDGTGPGGYNWLVTSAGSIVNGQGTKNIRIRWNTVAASQTIAVDASNACGTSAKNALTGITSSSCAKVGQDGTVLHVELYPNPAQNRSHYRFTSENEQSIQVRVTEISGKTVLAFDGMALPGMNEGEIDLGTLQSGMYLIQFHVGQQVSTERLIISR